MGVGDRPVGERAGHRARGAARPGAARRPAHGDSRAAALPVERGRAGHAPRRPDRQPPARSGLERPCRARPVAWAIGGLPPHACRCRRRRARRPDAVPRVAPDAAAGRAPPGPLDRQLGSALVRRDRSLAARTGNRAPRSRPHRALGGVLARHSTEPGGTHSAGLPACSAHRRRIGGEEPRLAQRGSRPRRYRRQGFTECRIKTEATPQPCLAKTAGSVSPDPPTRFSRKRRSSYESQYR